MSNLSSSFLKTEEMEFAQSFLEKGYVIGEVESPSALNKIRNFIVDVSSSHLSIECPTKKRLFLDDISNNIEIKHLNRLRLSVIKSIRTASWFRHSYFSLAHNMISMMVGNELAMQKTINLSIQMPHDESSILPIHSDVLNGNSPFEVVLWIPLVDCFHTKSMYIVPPDKSTLILKQLSEFDGKTTEDIFRHIEPDIQWLTVPYGSYLLFSQNLLHGNRVNIEKQTRWSMNCRFKSLFSPYAEKKLGEYFEPITLRPATRFGLDFQMPGNFDD